MKRLAFGFLAALVLVCAAQAQPPRVPRTAPTGWPQGVDVNQLLEQMEQGARPGIPPRLGGPPQREALPAEKAPQLDPEKEFRRFAAELLLDGELPQERREQLLARAEELGIGREEALETAKEVAGEKRKVFAFLVGQIGALAEEDTLGEEDRRFLEMRARDLGLGPWEASATLDLALEKHRTRRLYRSFLEAFLEDGVLDASEKKRLEEKRAALELTDDEHSELLEAVRAKKAEPAQDLLGEIRERDRTLQELPQELELYGRRLFQRPPESFEPDTGVPPPDSYVVGPGDTFEVSLWGRMEAEYQLVVDPEGRVRFPKVGPVAVGGLSYAEARARLKRKAESITGVSAAVAIAGIRPVRVFVVGEAENPGAVTLTPLATVVNAVMAAGGPTPIGSLRHVLLRRGGRRLATIDLYQFLHAGRADGNQTLQSGDVVVIPKARLLVELTGEVRRPAVYELLPGEGIRELLHYAGGLSAEADRGRVQVKRSRDHEERVVLDAALSEIQKDFPLQDGDAVRVFPLPPEIANEVSLFGHVHHPGIYAYRQGMGVRDLLSSPQALKPDVDLDYAVVLRETGPDRSKTVVPFHLGRALDGSDPSQNLPLRPRDEVYVFARDQFRPPLRAQAGGEVRKPGLYRIEQGARVADLVRLAGGLTHEALLSQAEVLRYLPDHSRKTLYVDLGRALQGDPEHNLELADEDELVVHSVWNRRFREVVLIEGEIQGAFDDELRHGKTVQERFAELLEAEQTAARQGQREQPNAALLRDGARQENARGNGGDENPSSGPQAVEVPLTEGMTVRDLVFKAGGLTRDAYLPLAHLYRTDRTTKEITIHTFDLGKALAGDPTHDLELRDLDHVVVHSAFEFAPIRKVTVGGRVNHPGDYPYAENMRVLDLILAAGGLTEEAYLGEAEVVRTEVVGGERTRTYTLTVSLARAQAGDPEANLLLQPYDKLFVKQIPDWAESRRIVLRGEVRFPGTYYAAKGETLSSILRRAGGYTEEAYLRGAVFTRESARVQQQRRLDQLREQLEQMLLRASSEEVISALSPEDVAAQKQYLASQQMLLKRIEASRATGRVVVRLAPLDELEESAQDISVEDGDTLTIPERPQTVEVVGQVYNPTSLLWDPRHPTVEYYLQKTGGPTPDAQSDRIYVVLADGTVVSPGSSAAGGWWTRGNLLDYEIQPGDTVLVPEKVIKTSFLKLAKDVSQIVYQVALTAGVFLAVY